MTGKTGQTAHLSCDIVDLGYVKKWSTTIVAGSHSVCKVKV